ncbi:MAG: class I SAM-dependent methyltransferase [Planctomycetota bacterium]|nr:MAG: class I SAM-dependent methyltransferase [Planctomycetota bacterium]
MASSGTNVDPPQTESVEDTLSKPYFHQQWRNEFYSDKNEKFYDYAIDYLVRFLQAPENSVFLDAGCGIGGHSIRLARHGYRVRAIDFSESAVEIAQANIQANALQDMIELSRENLLSLPFEDETFDYVICWGVLMHIPELEKALSTLVRVLKRGGTLVISEGNAFSMQSVIIRNLKRLLGIEKTDIHKTRTGIEHWVSSPAGRSFLRHTNIGWLIGRLRNDGFTLKKRIAGQFTELYTKVPSRPLKNLIYHFNSLWFKYIKVPYPAFGNIIILQKKL